MKKETFMEICRSNAKAELTKQETDFYLGIGEAVERAFKENADSRNSELKKIETQMGEVDDGKSIMGVVRSLAQDLESLEAKSKRGLSLSDKFNLRKKLEEKREVIKRATRGGEAWDIEFRAKRADSALMTTATVLSGASAVDNPNFFDDMDVVFIRYPKNFIIDAIRSTRVDNVPATWGWKEESTAGTGKPAATSEGSTKPLVDKKFIWKYAQRAKYAGRLEMTEEVEIDFEQLVVDIINMFERDVLTAWQDGVLADVLSWADTYSSSGLDEKIILPTVYSVIGAMKLQIQAENFDPDVVIMNPADAAEAIYLQDNNGSQQFIPENLQFGGLRPILSNKITAGNILVGTSATIQEKHSNYIIRKGVYNEQFIDNEFTIVGEIFSILKTPTRDNVSWVYADIKTVKQALLKTESGTEE